MLQTRKPRGVVILFSVFVVIMLVGFGGLAIDVGSMLTERSELHRATDAAALAGAGNLGLNDSVFPAVRDAAVDFGSKNPTRFGAVSLNRNDSNNPNGDVVLGVWNAGTFTPSLDGSTVNAVLCRTQKSFPTSFLRIIGLNSLNMSADSIAVSNPIGALENKCPFPVGMSACSFFNGGVPASDGCGMPTTFISSSSNPGSNTAAWVNLDGTSTPNTPYLRNALANAANGTGCSVPDPPEIGEDIGVNNGMVQPAMDDAEMYFKQKWNDGTIHTVTRSNGTTTVYQGRGWEVYLPLIQTDCPVAGAISGNREILGFARFVMVQTVNHGNCAVTPAAGNMPTSDQNNLFTSHCATGDPNYRAIIGYFDCNIDFKAPPGNGGPRAVLSDRMRLVR